MESRRTFVYKKKATYNTTHWHNRMMFQTQESPRFATITFNHKNYCTQLLCINCQIYLNSVENGPVSCEIHFFYVTR